MLRRWSDDDLAKYGRKVSSEAYRRRTRARPPRNKGEGSPVTNFAEEEAASRGRDQAGPGGRGFRSTNTLSGHRAEPGSETACSCGGRHSPRLTLSAHGPRREDVAPTTLTNVGPFSNCRGMPSGTFVRRLIAGVYRHSRSFASGAYMRRCRAIAFSCQRSPPPTRRTRPLSGAIARR
jgi:hypothetical protein